MRQTVIYATILKSKDETIYTFESTVLPNTVFLAVVPA